MALSTGSKLGPYEIVAPLGAGGMGEVYRARDTRLGRDVAVKVLNSSLSANPELKARFEREARAISALQHPNICVLHDVGNEGGTDFLVMEYLEGESLHDRLKRGALPVDQLLKIAIEVADALEKAHRAGIIHRDLKPGNVMLTKMGAKLLDFGLAKPAGAMAAGVTGSGPSQSVFAAAMTMTSPASPLTSAGSIVGTVQYMSPEQIEGREADARSDIFAFGLMLYEMAAGKRAFEGKTQASIVASILALEPPPISSIKPDVPAPLARVIHTCIQKEAEERFQSAHDLKLQLEMLASFAAHPAKAAAPAPAKSTRMLWAAIAVLALAAAAGIFAWWRVANEPKPVVRSYIEAPDKTVFDADNAVLSPNGLMLAFTATVPGGSGKSLWVRPLDSLTAQPLAGTEGAQYPFWSADSKHLAYFAASKLRKVDAAGGPPQILCDSGPGRGGAWNADGIILFAPGATDPLLQVSASGGTAKTALPFDAKAGDNSFRWPQFLPDGKHFIFWGRSSAGADRSGINVGTLGSSEHRLLVPNETNGVYADGRILFVRAQSLVAQPFDLGRLQFTGDAVPIADGVGINGGIYRGTFTASEQGTLGYFAGDALSGWPLVILDKNGKASGRIYPQAGRYTWPSFSPDGKRIALAVLENTGGTKDIWIIDVQRASRTRLTFEPSTEDSPVWSADGSKVFYSSNAKGNIHIYARAANGSTAKQETILETDSVDEVPTSVSRDGRYLAYFRRAVGKKYEAWILPLFGDHKPFALVQTQFNSVVPVISPDGKWVAYMSDESGRFEVYITPFSGGPKWQASTSQGSNPLWSPDGKKLYFLDNATHIMVVDVRESGNAVELGTAQIFAPDSSLLPSPAGPVAMAPDGRILINGAQSEQQSVNRPMMLVTNWPAELKQK